MSEILYTDRQKIRKVRQMDIHALPMTAEWDTGFVRITKETEVLPPGIRPGERVCLASASWRGTNTRLYMCADYEDDRAIELGRLWEPDRCLSVIRGER